MRAHRLVILILALSPAAADAAPIPQEPSENPDFIGRVAEPRAVLAPQPPRHPFMAPNERSNLHNDAYSSDVNPSAGPLGNSMQVVSNAQFRECASVTFDSRGRIVTVCVGVDAPALVMFDPTTLDELARFPLPPRQPGSADVLTSFGGGGYFYLDERDRAVIPTTTRDIWVVQATEQPGFRLERTYSTSAQLPPNDSIVSALPDFNGVLWFVTNEGFVGTVNFESGQVRVHRLEGEGITNSFSSDETGGVYLVSDRALYRFDAAADGAPSVTWRQPYENSLQKKPGQVDDGSGTTPTLMGDDLVNITDNADPMNVVVYKRGRDVSGERIVCRQPIFDAGASATDNSIITTDRSMVIENNYGYASPQATQGGRTTTPGLVRVDLLPRGRGCAVRWRSDETSPSIVPKLSLANGLVYAYTKLPGDDDDPWYLTAIDFRTGETVYKKLSGAGLGFNNHYAPATIGPNGTMYVGVLGGIVAMRDATPPAAGEQTPRLRIGVRARRGRGCARARIRATLRARGGGQPDPEQVRHVVFRAGRHRLRRDDHFPLSRLVPRRLVPKSRVYRIRARVTLGDGRVLKLSRRLRTC